MAHQSGSKYNYTGFWDVLYDFLDDIFASAIPGTYFISYFLFIAVIYFESGFFAKLASIQGTVFFLLFIALCYCFGTMFRRSDVKKVDIQSARYIYRRQAHSSANPFAFAPVLEMPYVQQKRDQLIILHRRYASAVKRARIKRPNDRKLRPPGISRYPSLQSWLNNRLGLPQVRSLVYLRKYAYRLIKKVKKSHFPLDHQLEHERLTSDLHALIFEIDRTLSPLVEYPYHNLYDYLKSRDMDICQYVPWTMAKSDSRTKMKINEYKVLITLHAPHMTPTLNKNEAHIRFMNSMWYSARSLMLCSLLFSLLSIVMLIYASIVTPATLLENTNFTQSNLILLSAMSVIYYCSSLFIMSKVRRILHYQRVRELVYILEAYDVALKVMASSDRYAVQNDDLTRFISG